MQNQQSQEKQPESQPPVPSPSVQKPASQQPNLDDALDDIINDKGLNISNDSAGDDFFDPKIQEQYKKFMKEMGMQGSGAGGLDDMMKNLLSSISPPNGNKQSKEGEGNKEDEEFKSTMDDLLKGLEGGNLEDVANKLLNKFMDKEILEEPLQETKKAYEEIFANPSKVKASEDDLERYRKQYLVVNDILAQLQKDPNNKEALIKKFEEMQQYGTPPEGINVGM